MMLGKQEFVIHPPSKQDFDNFGERMNNSLYSFYPYAEYNLTIQEFI